MERHRRFSLTVLHSSSRFPQTRCQCWSQFRRQILNRSERFHDPPSFSRSGKNLALCRNLKPADLEPRKVTTGTGNGRKLCSLQIISKLTKPPVEWRGLETMFTKQHWRSSRNKGSEFGLNQCLDTDWQINSGTGNLGTVWPSNSANMLLKVCRCGYLLCVCV